MMPGGGVHSLRSNPGQKPRDEEIASPRPGHAIGGPEY
jgi:hypothetical protein